MAERSQQPVLHPDLTQLAEGNGTIPFKIGLEIPFEDMWVITADLLNGVLGRPVAVRLWCHSQQQRGTPGLASLS